VIAPKLLIFIGVVLVLGFVLLTLAFRSLLIPAVAAVMNLLAANWWLPGWLDRALPHLSIEAAHARRTHRC
jgi:putative drug exporter of the RND superfamily